jgi:mannose-6-phosphate isomerase-like protein (cupin superfamily)
MKAFEIADIVSQQEQSGRLYHEFLRVEAMSAGLYVLTAGSADLQEPHTEDEAYYIVSGKASIRVGNEDRPVEAGSLVFVPAGIEHHFHSITEDLRTLVFFAPAEDTANAG